MSNKPPKLPPTLLNTMIPRSPGAMSFGVREPSEDVINLLKERELAARLRAEEEARRREKKD